MAVAATAMTN